MKRALLYVAYTVALGLLIALPAASGGAVLGMVRVVYQPVEPAKAPLVSESAAPRPLAVLTDTILLQGEASGGYYSESFELPNEEMIEEEVQRLLDEADAFVELLTEQEKPALSPDVPSLIWPLRPSRELSDYGYYAIYNYVDHDPNYPYYRLDYNCGTRTYDLPSGYNHDGTDYSLWPFPWKKVEYDEVAVVAAAPGIIVSKKDGNYDRECVAESKPWNAITLQHSDGSRSIYGHLKMNSLTSKEKGDLVEQGEFLGIVASSGTSGWPHLHFILKNADREIIDPYHGPCNPSPSLWVSQPPYYDSGVNLLTTGHTSPEIPGCPEPEIPNIDSNFAPGDSVFFTLYYRHLLNTQTSVLTVYEPDGTIYSSWQYSTSSEHLSMTYSYWWYDLGSDVPTGTWRFEVIYEGKTYETYFNVDAPAFITVLSPNGNEIWHTESTQNITWADNLGGEVHIELYRDGAYHSSIAKSTSSNGQYAWTIPADVPEGTNYRIRVTNVNNPTLFDESDGAFAIKSTWLPMADFVASPTSGPAPLTVVFTDTSIGRVDSWLWEFGDTFTSTQQNPTHIYETPGAYTVSLSATGPDGTVGDPFCTDTLTRANYIAAQEANKLFLPVLFKDD